MALKWPQESLAAPAKVIAQNTLAYVKSMYGANPGLISCAVVVANNSVKKRDGKDYTFGILVKLDLLTKIICEQIVRIIYSC
jgi:uncharacterized membrane protein